MHSASLLSVLPLLPAAAVALPSLAKRSPSYTLDQSFSLLARVTKPPCGGTLDVDRFVVSSVHFAAGQDLAALVANDSSSAARTFYTNGTADQVRYGTSSVLSEGGSPPFPYAWFMVPDGASAAAAADVAEINAGGTGTPGVHIGGVESAGPGFPDDNPYLAYYNTSSGSGSQFLACNTTVYGSIPVVGIRWRNDGGATPEGCAEVVLLPQCAGPWADGGSSAPAYLQQSPCYADAGSADPSTLRQS